MAWRAVSEHKKEHGLRPNHARLHGLVRGAGTPPTGSVRKSALEPQKSKGTLSSKEKEPGEDWVAVGVHSICWAPGTFAPWGVPTSWFLACGYDGRRQNRW